MDALANPQFFQIKISRSEESSSSKPLELEAKHLKFEAKSIGFEAKCMVIESEPFRRTSIVTGFEKNYLAPNLQEKKTLLNFYH